MLVSTFPGLMRIDWLMVDRFLRIETVSVERYINESHLEYIISEMPVVFQPLSCLWCWLIFIPH